MKEADSHNSIPPFLQVSSWPRYFDWPTVAGLRWLIYNAERNGFDRVIRRCGRRVLISTEHFHAWIEQHTDRARGGDARR